MCIKDKVRTYSKLSNNNMCRCLTIDQIKNKDISVIIIINVLPHKLKQISRFIKKQYLTVNVGFKIFKLFLLNLTLNLSSYIKISLLTNIFAPSYNQPHLQQSMAKLPKIKFSETIILYRGSI